MDIQKNTQELLYLTDLTYANSSAMARMAKAAKTYKKAPFVIADEIVAKLTY